MTTNALTFMKNEEEKRHNRAMEEYYTESNRINTTNAESNRIQAIAATRNAASNERNAESNARQAAASESQALTSQWAVGVQSAYNTGWLEETQRHNQAQEEINERKRQDELVKDTVNFLWEVAGWVV